MLYVGREIEKAMRRERRMMDMRNWVAIEDLGVLSFFLFSGFLDSSFVVRNGLSLFEGGMWLALEGRCPWREKSFTRGRAGLVIGRLESKVSYKYSWRIRQWQF